MLDYTAKIMKFGDVIKVDNQLNCKQGDYPGLPGWVQCNHKVISDKGRQERLLELYDIKRTQLAIAGFEDKEGDLKPRNVGFVEAGKDKEKYLSLRGFRKEHSCQQLNFSSVRPKSDI